MKNLKFLYGQILTPEHDTIGSYFVESGRTQLCIDKDMLDRLSAHRAAVDWSTWKRGPWVCKKGRDVTRVSTTNHGWRAYHRIDRRGPQHILGHVLGDLPLLFPTAEDAIVAAELFTTGSEPDLPFMWQDPYCGPRRGAPTPS
jgi:hypothetical protein